MGKMTVFPTRKLKIALSLNRGIGQVTYLRNIVDRYPVYSWLTVLSCLRDYRREKQSLKSEPPFCNTMQQVGANSEINFSTTEPQDEILSQYFC